MDTESAKPVRAAGGVLFKKTGESPQVLLIYRNGVWDLPKGKCECEETDRACGSREVMEEVGLNESPFPKAYLCETYHTYRLDSLLIGKTTSWYAMEFNGNIEQLEPERQEGITKLQWLKAGEAIEHVGYENLRKVLNTFTDWYKKNRHH